MSYAILILLWGAWCALHSAMISTTVTEYVKRKLERGFRFYRLFFNVLAAVTLVPVLLYDRSFHEPPLVHWDGTLRVVQGLLLGTSLFLFLAGLQHYDMAQLVGVRQAKRENSARPIGDNGRLHKTGILGVTRHPWYLATMILIWSLDISMADLARNTVLTAYLILGAALEERKLVLEFGDEYRDYQRGVSMLFPWKWLRGRTRG
jgi:methanethiol S-methyltransferase